MRRTRLCVAAVGTVIASQMFVGNASAADLGGDCCADLEERIAELESTTARKGNRKVSLTISGWVANQLTGFDNGATSNLYVTGIGSTLGSHVKFTGAAQITADVSAGYVMQIEMATSDPITAGNSAYGAQGPSALGIVASNGALQYNQPELLYSYWFMKSSKYGQVNVGLIPQASEHAAILVDGSGSLVPANWAPLDGLAIDVSRHGVQLQLPKTGFPVGALMWCSSTALPVAGDCNAIPINGIRYDTPTWHGFSASTSFGGDDFWDVTGRFATEHAGFKFSSAIAYSRNTDEQMFQGFDAATGLPFTVKVDAGYLQMGAYLEHVATGVFLYGAYGKEFNNNVYRTANQTDNQPSGNNWYLKAGLREKWNALGHTVLYGEYGMRNDMYHPELVDLGVTGSELKQWGLGAVQEIDAAAMSLWINYKSYDPSFSGPGVAGAFDDLANVNVYTAGALIGF